MSEYCDSPRRDDGLASNYDVILLGTGLVQSIVSCVASKHGKKVLHLESNEFYGEDYGCHTLSAHIAHYSNQNIMDGVRSTISRENAPNSYFLNDKSDQTIIVQRIDNVTAAKGLARSQIPFKPECYHPASFGYAMESNEDGIKSQAGVSPVFEGYASHHKFSKARLWLKDRDFNIDTTAKVLYGSCPMVDLMVASGVSNYLEFKNFEGLYFWLHGGAAPRQGTGIDGHMWKVPCSRNDVFNTTVLGALEKRSLMKFHQFVADWGRERGGKEVTSLNEVELAVGRSLYRPQNKQQAFSGYNVDAFIDRPFVDFLEDCKISTKLQRIIIYALCCHTAPLTSTAQKKGANDSKLLLPCCSNESFYTTREGLCDMFMHIDSIGRFGETAFLSPLYGSSEVVQAFCRMSAVWGGTFILRRSVSAASCFSACEDDSIAADAATSTARAGSTPRVVSVLDSEGNSVECGAFVCSAGYWKDVPTQRSAVLTCTSVWLGVVVPIARSIIIIPPSEGNGVRNQHAVHIIQTDASTHAAPEGAVVLHVSTVLDFVSSSHGASWQEQARAHSAQAAGLVDTVVEMLQTMPNVPNPQAAPAVELSRVVTLKPVYDLRQPTSSGDGDGIAVPWASSLPANVRLCTGASDATLSMQGAYDEAQSIFEQLFPDLDFSLAEVAPPSEEVQLQQDAASAENDDEAAYLEFALNAAMTSTSTPTVEMGDLTAKPSDESSAACGERCASESS